MAAAATVVLFPPRAAWDAAIAPALRRVADGKVTTLREFADALSAYRPALAGRRATFAGLEAALHEWPREVDDDDDNGGGGVAGGTDGVAGGTDGGTGAAVVDDDSIHVFFSRTLPSIAAAALRCGERYVVGGETIPLIPEDAVGAVELDAEEAKGLLAMQFLCAFPEDPGVFCDVMPVHNFDPLLASAMPQEVAKLVCFVHFFDATRDAPLRGRVRFSRRQVDPDKREAAWWASCDAPLLPVTVHTSGVIEDADPATALHADFANAYIGGGVLVGGCVQEEILFAVAPLCTVTTLMFPRMLDHEAIVIEGCERFTKTRGYAFGLKFDGGLDDPSARKDDGSVVTTVVAIDAIPYAHSGATVQFDQSCAIRDVVKAFAGFDLRGCPQTKVSTGNWGCGAFGGNIHFKSVLQWLAASAAKREMIYYSFGEGGEGFAGDFANLVADAARQGLRCCDLWKALVDVSKSVAEKKGARFAGKVGAALRGFLRERMGLA